MQIIECASSHLLLVVPDDSHLWRQGAPVPAGGRNLEQKKERARCGASPRGRQPKGAPRAS